MALMVVGPMAVEWTVDDDGRGEQAWTEAIAHIAI